MFSEQGQGKNKQIFVVNSSSSSVLFSFLFMQFLMIVSLELFLNMKA